MRFALSAEQRDFGAAVHDLLAAADVPAAARAWATADHAPGLAIWRSLSKAGVTALAAPASFGGLGAHPVDLVVACEELGHHPLPGPIAESVAAVPQLLAELARPTVGPPEPRAGQAGEWLAALAAGEMIATLAMPPQLPYAVDADIAGLVLLVNGGTSAPAGPGTLASSAADVGGYAVWRALPPGRLGATDRARRLFEVEPAQSLASGPAIGPGVARAISYGTLASAAQLLGAGRALLEATTSYARQREQFGRPIGAFQAVKHALADVLIGLEFARPLLYAAAIALGNDAPVAARDISGARVGWADAPLRGARTALQVHGAIGYTQECDISLWLAKVPALAATWGRQAEHRAMILAALTTDRTGPWS